MRKLAPAAQEERRRQVIGLRESGLTYEAIAAQAGLSKTGVFNICQRFAAAGMAGLASQPRGPEPGTGALLQAGQAAEVRALICQHTPDALGLPFALWSRAAVRALVERRCGGAPGRADHGDLPGALGLHGAEAAAARLRAAPGRGAALVGDRTTRPSWRVPGGRRA